MFSLYSKLSFFKMESNIVKRKSKRDLKYLEIDVETWSECINDNN
jgi:hypothetical protein